MFYEITVRTAEGEEYDFFVKAANDEDAAGLARSIVRMRGERPISVEIDLCSHAHVESRRYNDSITGWRHLCLDCDLEVEPYTDGEEAHWEVVV